MTAIWDLVWGTAEERLVLLAYADHADDEGGSIFPAVARVARKTGLSERGVQKITRRLEAAGCLIPDGTGPRGTRRWRMPLPLPGVPRSPPGSGVNVDARGVNPETHGGEPPFTRTIINPQEPSTTRTTSVRAPHLDPERAELERHFAAVTRLPVPKAVTDKQKREAGALWYAPLRAVLELAGDLDMAKRLVSETVTAMRNEKLTISSPNSILKVAQARFAANRPQPVPDFIHPQDRV